MIESGRSSLSGRERDGATASGAVGPPGTSTARCPALRARATGAVRLASGRGPQGPGPGQGAAPRGSRGRPLALGARGPGGTTGDGSGRPLRPEPISSRRSTDLDTAHLDGSFVPRKDRGPGAGLIVAGPAERFPAGGGSLSGGCSEYLRKRQG